ncbi:PIG-L family deacetylase [Nocardioides koreensis]|uniref:PIG-L family deacetylase n=1 Tax=Nocardioides koreensis TaxID=433651 RepID=A0ABP5LAW5_9ACTN
MIGLAVREGPLDVLCLGAHPDDVEIGCGGTLLQLALRSDVRVTGVVLTGEGERVREGSSALSRFIPSAKVETAELPDGRLPARWEDVKQVLEDVAASCAPDIVFAPRVDDAHQDHRLIGTLASTVWRNSLILHYEIPKWDGDLGAPTHFVPLDAGVARRKVELLNDCFPSQVGRDWWDDEFFLGLMRIRGVECRSQYAEGFFASKVVLDLTERGSAS